MRAFTAAAVQVAPLPGPLTAESVKGNLAKAADWVTRCVESTGAELVVLPESVTTGFSPGIGPEELWDLVVRGRPARSSSRCRRPRAGSACTWSSGTYERGARARRRTQRVGAARARRRPCSASTARRTRSAPRCARRGGWVTPGDEVSVVETDLGRIGQIICFDGDYPELSRITAVRGAEVIVRPSALLRSADIWELTNRARAYDNHVYVVGANATGIDPAGVLYFGNSMIVTPIAEVVARAASATRAGSARRLDPSDRDGLADAGLERPAGASTTWPTATSTSSRGTPTTWSARPRPAFPHAEPHGEPIN